MRTLRTAVHGRADFRCAADDSFHFDSFQFPAKIATPMRVRRRPSRGLSFINSNNMV